MCSPPDHLVSPSLYSGLPMGGRTQELPILRQRVCYEEATPGVLDRALDLWRAESSRCLTEVSSPIQQKLNRSRRCLYLYALTTAFEKPMGFLDCWK
ncbi:hypothetical protein cyc_08756 [Cyclospora cayetanensis]|uniref:Uncharacterized protein n=1 Tax=Cyclospora cayetanensis TaxID=88456 RepID=A0A1D3CT87_9EIME|nr:hypothetical protein cyc_08756 [Cyclospora cayetanensis]